MSNNVQQLNDPAQKKIIVSDDFDFDDEDILIKNSQDNLKSLDNNLKTKQEPEKNRLVLPAVLPIIQKKPEPIIVAKSDPVLLPKNDNSQKIKEKEIVNNIIVPPVVIKKPVEINKIIEPNLKITTEKPIEIKKEELLKNSHSVVDINETLKNNKIDVKSKKDQLDLSGNIKSNINHPVVPNKLIDSDNLVNKQVVVPNQLVDKAKTQGVFGWLKNVFNHNKKVDKNKIDSGHEEPENKFYWLASDESDLVHAEHIEDKSVIVKKDILDKIPEPKKESSILINKNIAKPLETKAENNILNFNKIEDKSVVVKKDVLNKALEPKKESVVLIDKNIPKPSENIADNNLLTFDKNDEQEIKQIENQLKGVDSSQVIAVVKDLVLKINKAYNLKINLIERLKIIIELCLRDVRSASNTKILLQRSVADGGMQFSDKQADQIMVIISQAYQKIHQVIPEKTDIISKQTAQKAQLGVFSQEIQQQLKKKADTLDKENKAKALLDKKNTTDNADVKKAKPSFFRSLFAKKDQIKKIDKVENQIVNNIFNVNKITSPAPVPIKEDKNKDIKPILYPPKNNVEKDEQKIEKTKIQVESVKKEPEQITNIVSKEIINKKEDKLEVLEKPKVKELILPLEPKIEEKSVQKIIRIQPENLVKDQKPKLQDIKIVSPHLVGPAEELSEMSVADFRRLGPTLEDVTDKIREKIALATNESFSNRILCINAWQNSQPYQLYIDLGMRSLLQKVSIAQLANQDKSSKKLFLTQDEFELIGQLNREFRY